MNDYKQAVRYDMFMRRFITISASVSLIMLGILVFFMFYRGITPFVQKSTLDHKLIFSGISTVIINDVTLTPEQATLAQSIDKETKELRISVVLPGDDTMSSLRIVIDAAHEEPLQRVRIEYEGNWIDQWTHSIVTTEAYVYDLYLTRGLFDNAHIIVHLMEPKVNIFSFIFGLQWKPDNSKLYGIFPLIVATFLSTVIASIIAVPVSIGMAIGIAELAPPGISHILRLCIDILAGIPSVVYGFFGLMVIVPFNKVIANTVLGGNIASGVGLLSASMVLAIMIIPTIVAVSETALRAVYSSYKHASLALGASRMQTIMNVSLPSARSGIITSIILGIGRAIGETMAVIVVAGNSPQMPTWAKNGIFALFDSMRTMTATIGQEMGYATERHMQILFGVGMILFIFVLFLNLCIIAINKYALRYH